MLLSDDSCCMGLDYRFVLVIIEVRVLELDGKCKLFGILKNLLFIINEDMFNNFELICGNWGIWGIL